MFRKILNFLIITFTSIVIGLAVGYYVQTENAIQIVEKEILPFNFIKTNGTNRYNPVIRLNKKGNFFCSGVVIDGQYALTAAHCVVNDFGKMTKDRIDVTDADDMMPSVSAKAIAIDRYKDIALIKGDFKDFKTSEVDFNGANLTVLMGRKVMACGFPAGGLMFCSLMVVTGNYNFQYIGYGGYLYKGMSGGPVYDMETGLVIAVNSAVFEGGSVLSPTLGVNSTWGL